jgi:hypothetical protein
MSSSSPSSAGGVTQISSVHDPSTFTNKVSTFARVLCKCTVADWIYAIHATSIMMCALIVKFDKTRIMMLSAAAHVLSSAEASLILT